MAKENILVFCAHNDDQIIGPGGTLIKYAKEGKKVYTIIFSYGESSHPWYKKKVTADMRYKECMKSDKIMDIKNLTFFGLTEGRFQQEIEEKGIKERIRKYMKKYMPSKIFVHSFDDPHPDHRAVYKVVEELVDESGTDPDVYAYSIWNPATFRKRGLPKLVVDISEEFDTKIKALRCHRSQLLTLISLMWSIYFKNIIQGFRNKSRYAEVFYKIK